MPILKLVEVLDYDDTVLPLSVLIKEASKQLDSKGKPIALMNMIVSDELKLKLRELEAVIKRFLLELQAVGTVYFITNSETGWVLVSCIKFLPGLLPFLVGGPGVRIIPVISANSLYKGKGIVPSTDGAVWKYYALCQLLSLERSHNVYLMGVGDSDDERIAFQWIESEMITPGLHYKPPTRVKFIKLMNEPSIDDIAGQLDKITRNLRPYLHCKIWDLDIKTKLDKM
jgi:hypothetical protein